MDATASKVQEIVSEQLGVRPEAVKDASNFMEDLGADSLDMVELVLAIEDEFELNIPDDDAERLATVVQLTDYVRERVE